MVPARGRARAESTVVHFYLGEIYYNRGLNDEALVALERAVELNPDNANAHYLMAFVLATGPASGRARRVEARHPAEPAARRAQTNLSLERYNAERKSQERRQRLAPEPSGGRATSWLTTTSGSRSDRRLLQRSVEGIPPGAGARRGPALTLQAMAELHLLKRDLAAALELYDTLLREVRIPQAVERARRGAASGRPDRDAVASYRQAVEVDPKYALAWNNLGWCRRTAPPPIRPLKRSAPRCGSSRPSPPRGLTSPCCCFSWRFQLSLEAYRSAVRRAQLRGRVERRGTGAGGAQAFPRRAQRVRARRRNGPDHAGRTTT